MGVTIHQLRGVVTSDIKSFVLGMNESANVTRKLATAWNDARVAIWSASQRILTAVTAMTVGSVKQFADFEDAIVEVGAITRTLGTRDFEALKAAAIDMGEKTRYSATEAAEGLKQLSLSGLKANEAIQALPPTLQLASAAGVSIGQAASISAKMMKAMNIEARDLGKVNDVLVSTFQRSNTDLGMLSEGMKHAAPLSHALGVSLEDTTAILAKLADAGFQGEMGGTALRNIMSRLAGAMPRLTKQFGDLGIETLDSTGKMRPLLDVLEDIEEKGLSAGEIMGLFGQRGGPQLLALLEVGIKGVRNFSAETQKQMGVAADMQKARINTIKGQWDELMSFIDTILIDAGSSVGPEIKNLLNDFEEFLRQNKPEILKGMHDAMMGLVNGLQELRKYLTDNRLAMWDMLQTFGGFLKGIADFMAAHPRLMAALLALKITGILGLNNAVWMLGKAIVVTIQQMVALRAAALAATPAVAGTGAAATAAGAAGAAGAAKIGGAFALLASPAGAIAAVVIALGGIGLLFRQIRVDAELQIRKIEKALDDLAAKNRRLFFNNANERLAAIKANPNASDRVRGLAGDVEGRAADVARAQASLDDPTRHANTKQRAQEDVNAAKAAMEESQRAMVDEINRQFDPKISKAREKDVGASDALKASLAQLIELFKTGHVNANDFGIQLEKLDLQLQKVARGFDPQVEALQAFTESPFLTAGTKVFDQYESLLNDLNQVKPKLGATFGVVVQQIGILNDNLAKGLISEERFSQNLEAIRTQISRPLQNDKTGTIEAAIKQNALDAEKKKYGDFETIQGLVGQDKNGNWDTKNLNAAGMSAIGNSVEGATPEIVQQLADDFRALQLQGEGAVQEGFDQLILSFLKAVEKAKDTAEEQNNLIDSANEAYKRGGTQSDVMKYGDIAGNGRNDPLVQAFRENQNAAYNGTIGADAYRDRNAGLSSVAGQSARALTDIDEMKSKLQKAALESGANSKQLQQMWESASRITDKFRNDVKALTDQFANGSITEDQFTEKLKGLQNAMQDSVAAAEQMRQKEERLALLRGDFANAGKQFSQQEAFENRLAAFRTNQFNTAMDAMFNNFLYMNGMLPQVNQGFSNLNSGMQQFGDGLNRMATQAGNWFESGSQGVASIGQSLAGGWAALNSPSGQIAMLNNQISELAQILQMPSIRESRKQEVRQQIEQIANQIRNYQPPAPRFINASVDPFFADPGVTRNNQQAGQGGPSNFNFNFPNVDRITANTASVLYDAVERERIRRGKKP